MTPRFTLDYGLRWELYTPITERAHRTGGFLTVNGTQEYVVNPQPGYKTNWNGFGPRVQTSWQVTGNLSAHAGGAITVIPPNIWQDNFLTGSTPFVVYPRLVAAPGAPIDYGFQITPSQLPRVYTPQGVDIFASGNPKDVPPNTVMDVDRYEQDIAALTPSHVVSALSLSAIDRSFGNATLFTWTTGIERKIGGLTADASYVGTAAEKLPRYGFPNAYPGASPPFAPYTRFDKDTPIGRRSGGVERVDLQFRSELFNLFNIVNMGLPANILTGSGFGEISKTAGNSRQIQFSLKLIY